MPFLLQNFEVNYEKKVCWFQGIDGISLLCRCYGRNFFRVFKNARIIVRIQGVFPLLHMVFATFGYAYRFCI